MNFNFEGTGGSNPFKNLEKAAVLQEVRLRCRPTFIQIKFFLFFKDKNIQ